MVVIVGKKLECKKIWDRNITQIPGPRMYKQTLRQSGKGKKSYRLRVLKFRFE